MLEAGYLPASLNYNVTKTEILDYSKLDYVNFKKPIFFFNKLHSSLQQIPGIYKYCDEIANQSLTPLQLILQRQIIL